jgi:endo-beta-N-acetylglucosaminidase D
MTTPDLCQKLLDNADRYGWDNYFCDVIDNTTLAECAAASSRLHNLIKDYQEYRDKGTSVPLHRWLVNGTYS